MESTILIIVAAVIAIIFLGIVLTIMYVKASPSVALIISGMRKEPKVLVGKGGIKIPFLQRLDKLFLGQVTVDVKTSVPVPTHDFIDVMVDAVCKIQVDPTMIQLAAKNFLNMPAQTIAQEVKDSLEGNMREVVGAISLQNLVTDRDAFSDQIQEKAAKDMSKLGLKVISCNIQNITDQKGLIEGLGADNTYSIRKNASITKANAERDIAIAEQEAKKAANDVTVKTETEIAERNNELAIKRAELQQISDTKQAVADAAYEIQKQEQLKTINAKTVDAQIEQTKREQELAEQQVLVTENKLKAEVNAKANAAKYQKQVIADANKYQTQIDAEATLEQKKREAEALAYNAQKNAEAVKAQAEAKRYAQEQNAEAIKAQGLAEAAAIEAKGLAEAQAIEAKGLAEAKAIEKRYEAWNKFGGDLAKIEMLSKYLPQVAENVAKPISAIDSVNIYGGDGASSASKLTANVPTVIKQTIDTVKSVTGVDLGSYAQSKLNTTSKDHNLKSIDDVDFEDAN